MDPLLEAEGDLAFLAALGALLAVIGAATGTITGTPTGTITGAARTTPAPASVGWIGLAATGDGVGFAVGLILFRSVPYGPLGLPLFLVRGGMVGATGGGGREGRRKEN